MCSLTEPRRATVSCKNLFSSSTNDRSAPTSSSARRHANNNSNVKRNNNNNSNNAVSRSSKPPSQQQQKLNGITNESPSNANVFHVPFSVEQIVDHGRKTPSNNNNNNKLLRTSLNPLSPAFHSTRHTSLSSVQKEENLSSENKFLLLSETSDYGSSTDPELQSIQNISPQTDSSPFIFDVDESSCSYSVNEANLHPPVTRRVSLSSSSSSTSTSPSSSMSNLSSLSSSSSEFAPPFINPNRLTNKKLLSTKKLLSINNNHPTPDVIFCHCDKENCSNRKRNRFNSYTLRRYATLNTCETCPNRRAKCNSRSKCYSNRQQKTRFSHSRPLERTVIPIKFTVDLTGLNIKYTVDYHDNIKCTCSTTLLPYYNPYASHTRCKCSSVSDFSSKCLMMSSSDQDTNDFYYIDANNNCWIPQMVPTFFNNYDFYSSKFHDNTLSAIHFDDRPILDVNQDYLRFNQPPPTRSWLRLASPNTTHPTAIFTVMNYNILCDKYATRHVYGYCPSWALKWDYRRKQILDELRSYAADIIALQEIETDQFHQFFLPELQKIGYDGVFSPKSRAKTMCEQDRRFVDGCAIFYRQSKFRLIKDYLVEFNQLAMSAANGPAYHDMTNRVMTKDNIGLIALLETKEEIYSHTFSNGALPSEHKQMLFVCTAHIHWDPEYCDVKVVQTLMLLSELKTIMEEAIQKHRPSSVTPMDCTSVPLVLCGDFNSLPDSGVIELMQTGKISMNHVDFKDLRYESYLQKISRVEVNTSQSTDIVHHFKLQSAYETTSSPIMPYTNYTYDFKGIIDYVFFSSQLMRVLGVLGPLDPEWMQTNKIVGCPHPNVPSDHFSLLAEFELNPITHDSTANNNNSRTSTTPIPSRKQ